MLTNKKLIFLLFFSGGVFVDFLFNGVLKIVWIAIYGTVYLAIALGLHSRFHVKWGDSFAIRSSLSFLLGCLGGHLLFAGHLETRQCAMKLGSDQQIILQSDELSQKLYVVSPKVSQALGKLELGKTVSISIQVLKDYGCIYSFKVFTVAGVDVMNDPESSWVWKAAEPKSGPEGGFSGMGEENRRKFWCLINWF